MPGIDDSPIPCLDQAMSRPFRHLLPVLFLACALGLSGCVGTIYDQTYSYRRNHFKPPEERTEASADSILGALDKKPGAGAPDAGAALGAPDVPGLPPAGGAAAPAAPDAGAGAIPGLPAPPPPAAPPK